VNDRAILDALPEAVTVQDAEGALVYANPAAAALVGYESPEAMLAAGGAQAMAGWTSTHEDGRPLRAEDLPGRRALAGQAAASLVVRAIHNETGRLRWTRIQSLALDGHAVNLIEDITAVKLAELRQRLLAQAGQLLSGTPDVERTLEQVARLAVPELAEWCAFDVPDGRGGARLVAVAHSDPAKVELARELRTRFPATLTPEAGVGKAFAGGSEHYPDIPHELVAETAQSPEHLELLERISLRSAIVVPVRAGDEVFGALTLVDGARSLTEADFQLALDLGRRAGQAIATARLFEQRTYVARTLQAALLPPTLPSVAGWDLAALFAPAAGTDIGGDFYDLFFARDGWWLVVGDVCGRGTAAAALTSMARYSLRSAAQLADDPAVAVAQVNRALRDHGDLALCTLALIRVGRDGAVQLLRAGHPPAAVLRNGHVDWAGPVGPLLGALDDAEWQCEEVPLGAGESIVLYTDGVTDLRGSEERFGPERLAATLAGAPRTSAGSVLAGLESALDAFAEERDDDAAAVCAHRTAA
jgi:PAS domain S-box-containing protein